MNRQQRTQLAQETVEISQQGWYLTAEGARVELGTQIERCLEQTRLFRPGDSQELPPPVPGGKTRFDVRNETTLAAARRLVVEQRLEGALALNFASAMNPGGGFLGGSQAQEESLARASALYISLLTQPAYYEANRACKTALYTDHLILSPQVPVFRDDDGALLDEPYLLSILTAPAVNARAVRANESQQVPRIRPTMQDRIDKVLRVAAAQGYTHLILGAWGCGVFGNDPQEIAQLLADTLGSGGSFADRFASVTFAVLDNTEDRQIVTPFEQHFTGMPNA